MISANGGLPAHRYTPQVTQRCARGSEPASAVGVGVGTQHRPHSVRPCGPALLAVGLAEGRPRVGAFHRCEGRLRSGAPPPPTAPPLGGPFGSATHVLWARVCGCGGPTLSPWPACPVGAACRGGGVPWRWWGAVPRGARLPRLWGVSGVRRCPSPGRPSSGAGSRGSATRVSRVRSVRVCGPSTGPTARALPGGRCGPLGWRKGVPGGGVFHRCEGRQGSGAPPPPSCPPSGRAAGAHYRLTPTSPAATRSPAGRPRRTRRRHPSRRSSYTSSRRRC